jgi:rhodanese-related sulfurtransferase
MTTGPFRTLEQLLAEASTRIHRYQPAQAFTAASKGALIIDTRSDLDRQRDGIIPGSLHIPRTVLEWRLAPSSPYRTPHVTESNQQLLLICDHGCSSILAAASLVDLGLVGAGDIIGGFAAWSAAGLPITSAPPPRHAHEPPGMRPPDR